MATVEEPVEIASSSGNTIHFAVMKAGDDSDSSTKGEYDEGLVEEVVVTDGHFVLTSEGDHVQVPDPVCEVVSDGNRVGYSCLKCGAQFETSAAFESHDKTHHGTAVLPRVKRPRITVSTMITPSTSTNATEQQFFWQCGSCNTVFINEDRLKQHQCVRVQGATNTAKKDDNDEKKSDAQKEETPAEDRRVVRRVVNEYLCPGCGYMTNNKKYFATHLSRNHPKRKLLECEHCSERFSSMRAYQRHVKTHVEDGDMHFMCPDCDKKFPDHAGLEEHNKSNTCAGRRTVCEHCAETFSTRAEYNTHMKIHDNVSCDICMKTFSNKYTLDTHRARIHGQVRDGITRNLKRYYRNDLRSDPCPICGKTYCNDALLQAHVKEHKGEYAYQCDTCGKPFNYKNSWKAHLELHENHAYTCPKCNSVYKTKVSLNTHIRTVHKPKKHICDQCGRKFATTEHIRAHMRTHTGEKPFRCEYCTQSFAQLATLQNHVRNIHHKLKPYKCDRCDEEFHRPGQLEKHLQRFHGGSGSFQCVVCGEIFASVRVLKTHLMELHVDELTSESESDDHDGTQNIDQ